MTETDKRDKLKEQVSLLPDMPGVYRFLNDEGVVIYVGKAKNLKKRVSSYFVARADHNNKVRALVRHIDSIMHTVVESEADALLLENNMIKSLQPKYNILLKDDKTYPWIQVTRDPYPCIVQTRRVDPGCGTYFGPYASVSVQKNMLDLVRKLYMIRTCRLKLTPEGVVAGRFDLCLEYHIGNCKAPCVGHISQSEYVESVRMAMQVLRGNLREAEDYLKSRMDEEAAALRFEEAERIKERLHRLENYRSRSVVVSAGGGDMDVFFPVIDGYTAYCSYMHVVGGAIINSYTIEMKLAIEEDLETVLSFAIARICEQLSVPLARDVIVPLMPADGEFEGHTFTVPLRGDKFKLLTLCERNCRLYRLERLKQMERSDPSRHTDRLMETMRRELGLKRQPRHMECFDNSNLQGTYPVSSCVVFRDGRPAKRDYRHFNIKSVVGIDDFASMAETLTRRYGRMIEEGTPLPDLIVVDGGKGQLSSAYKVLCDLGIDDKVEIVGLAKRLEEIFYPGDSTPLYLDKSGETLKVLMHIRDEAHRFGITFHRNKRSAGQIKSRLEQIPSVGKASVERLIKRFKSIKGIQAASIDDIASVIGRSRAEAVKNYLTDKDEPEVIGDAVEALRKDD